MGLYSIISDLQDLNKEKEQQRAKTSYQQNLASPAQNSQPQKTAGQEAMEVIAYFSKINPTKASELYNYYQQERGNANSKYYDRYATPTNRAAQNLMSYGFDMNNLNQDWIKQNSNYILSNLSYNGTTNTPSKPNAKKATRDQLIAYELYQWDKSEGQTKKAEQQWEALQQELTYLAQDKNRNYSDEAILSMIDWSKYSELEKMDNSSIMAPNEYNRGIGYSKDAMYGVLWAARNGGGTGNNLLDTGFYFLGDGKQWVEDKDITAKLYQNNPDTFSPYEVGMTATDVGKYFNVYELDRETLDDIQKNLDWNDKTEVENYQAGEAAFNTTQTLKTELSDMYAEIEELEKWYSNPEDIIDIIKANDAYKDLFDLDETMKKGPKYGKLVQTTSAIPYKWEKIEQKIRDDCEEKRKANNALMLATIAGIGGFADKVPSEITTNFKTKEDVRNEAAQIIHDKNLSEWEKNGGELAESIPTDEELRSAYDGKYGDGAYDYAIKNADVPSSPLTEADKAMEEDAQKTLENLEPIVQAAGTDGEKIAMQTGKTSFFDKVMQIASQQQEYAAGLANTIKDQINNSYVDDVRTIFDYDEHKNNRDYAQSELERIYPEWLALSNRFGIVEGVNSLTYEEYNNLMTLPQTENWEYWENILSHPERAEQDKYQAELYDQALLYLYQQTRVNEFGMHDYGFSDMGTVREVAPKLFRHLMSVKQNNESASPVEVARQQALETGEYNVDVMIPNGGVETDETEDSYYTLHFAPDENGNLELKLAIGNVTGDVIANESEMNYILGYIPPVEPLSPEEMERFKILSDKKTDEERKIAEEEKYLKDHEASYKTSQQNKVRLEQAAEASALTPGGVNPGILGNTELTVKAAQIGGNIMPAPYSMYDKKVMDGDMTRDEASVQSVITAQQNLQYAQSIRDTVAQLDEGVLSEEEKKKALACADVLEYEGKAASYTSLDGNVDFGAMFALGQTEAMNDTGIARLLTYVGRKLPERDTQEYYDLQNELIKAGALDAAELAIEWYNILESITPEEVRRFYYLYKKDSKEDALKYFDFISDPNHGELTVRKNENWRQYLTEWSDKGALYAGGAWLASVAIKPVANASMFAYRLGGGTSAENPMASIYSDVNALRAGVSNNVERFLGENTFWGEAGKRTLNVGTGLVDLWVNNKIITSITSMFGGFGSKLMEDTHFTDDLGFGNVANQANSLAVTTKLAYDINAGENAVYTILGLSVDSSNATWDKVIRETHDPEKADKMSLVSFLSSMLTHTVIMNGIGRVLNSNPGDYYSKVGEFAKNLITNASTIGFATGIAESGTKAAEKEILGEDSFWGKAFAKYKSMDYSDTMAEQAADADTWNDTCNKISEAVVDSLIRTTMTTAAKQVAPKVKDATDRVMDKLKVLKKYYEPMGEGTPLVLEDENPYNVEWANKYAPGEVRWYKPSDGTQAFVRVAGDNQTTYAVTGYRYDRGTNTIYLIDMAGNEIPFNNVQVGFAVQLAQNESGNATRGLFMDIAQNYDEHTGVFAEPIVDPEPSDPYAMIVPQNPKETQKDVALLMAAHSSDTTAASVAVASVLSNSDPNASKAAGQSIVGDIANGDPKLAATTMQSLIVNGADKESLTYAALTNGGARQALEEAFKLTLNGGDITPANVSMIRDMLIRDRKENPAAFEEGFQKAVRESMISNRTIEIMRETGADKGTEAAKENLKSEEQKLAAAKEQATALWTKFATAGENMKRAEAEYNPSVPETAGPLEQTTNEYKGMAEQVKQAQATADVIQNKVDQAKEDLQKASEEALATARPQAVADVNQQIQENAEASYNNGIAMVTPLEAFGHSIQVFDSEGRPVNITGVYDRVDAGENFIVNEHRQSAIREVEDNYGQPDLIVMYTTEDGRLVMENPGKTNDDGETIRGYGDVDTEGNDEVMDAADLLIGNNANGSDSRHPAIRPVAYFPSSFPLNVNGQAIQMIGVSGKISLNGEEYPVIMGMDGKEYVASDDLDIPFKNADAMLDAYYDNEDILEEKPDAIRLTGGEEDVAEGREEDQNGIVESITGVETEGNNEGQLAEQSGSVVGLGDNGNAESDSGQEEYERGSESLPADDGQDTRRITERLLSQTARNKLYRKGITSTALVAETDAQKFSDYLNAARENNPYKLFVDPQTPQELADKGAIMLRSKDGNILGAIGTKGIYKGDIFAVCKNPKSKAANASRNIIISAVAQGGNKLDCYNGNPQNPGLPRMFSSVGMIPVARVVFSRDFHLDDGWNYDRDGEPDVIFWMLKPGETAESIIETYGKAEADGGYHKYTLEELERLPVFEDTVENGEVTVYGYDKAWSFRDECIERGEIPESTLSIVRPEEVVPETAEQSVDTGNTPYTPSETENPSVITSPDVNAEASVPAQDSGTTPPPVNPTTAKTTVQIPSGPVRQWNMQGAQQTNLLHDKIKQHLIENAAYDPRHNSEDFDNAITWVAEHAELNDPTGFWSAVTEATSGDFNPLSVEGQARMMVLMSMAATDGFTEVEQRLVDVYADARTEIGQALQIGKMYTLMTRQGREIYFDRMTQKAEDEYNSHRSKKNKLKLHFSPELRKLAGEAKTAEEFAKARKMLDKELAEQIPSDWALRLRTWRYFAMLQGTGTHARNVEGNLLAKVVLIPIKNAIATVLERKVGKVPVGERTKAIKLDPEAKEFAKQISEKYKDVLQGNAGGKYLDLSGIEANRKAFGSGKGRTIVGRFVSKTLGRGVQKTADVVSNALEWEDWLFLKPHFEHAFASYMTANGYKPKDMTGNVLEKGLNYAIDQAKTATYRKFSKLAKWFSDPTNKPAAAQFLFNALQPFVKTGVNIAKLGYEYSPFGLAQSIIAAKKQLEAYKEWEEKGFKGKKPKNAKSPGEVYDRIAEGLTGLGLAGVGALLSSLGLLKIKATPSEKRNGHNDYSLELFGWSIPISNMIPAAMPVLFGGAANEAYEEFKEGEGDFGDVLNMLSSMVEPSFETTLWSSWTGWLGAARNVEDANQVTSVLAEKAISNWLSSFMPAWFTNAARVIDPTQRKAYVPAGTNSLESVWTTFVEQMQNKLPFFSRSNPAYLNEWGEEKTTDWFTALLNNWILPDKITKIEDNELDELLAQMEVEPNFTREKVLKVNNEKIPLTGEQWEQYSKHSGAYAKEVLEELIHRPEFVGIDNVEAQQELVKKVYKYARAKATLEMFPEKNITDGWVKGALTAPNVIDYIFEKEEESAKADFIKDHKNSLKLSIQQDNMNAAMVDIDSLRTAGVENSSIKSYVTREIKPLYKEAYEDGDRPEMERIKAFLRKLDVGYDDSDFNRWEKVDEGSAAELHSHTKGTYYALGNIDINNRKVLQNPDGTISTENSFSFYDDNPESPHYGKEVLIPSIINGKAVSQQEAKDYYYKTGEYLGAFDTSEEAKAYGKRLQERQDWYYNQKKTGGSTGRRLIASGAISDVGTSGGKTYEGAFGFEGQIVDGKFQSNQDSNLNGVRAEDKNGRLWFYADEDAEVPDIPGTYVSYEMRDAERELYRNRDGECYGLGTIDLNHRKVVHNEDGSISTEYSITVGFDDKVYLLPTVIDGKIVDEDEAIQHFLDTDEYLGVFDDEAEAINYAQILHRRQEWYYNR